MSALCASFEEDYMSTSVYTPDFRANRPKLDYIFYGYSSQKKIVSLWRKIRSSKKWVKEKSLNSSRCISDKLLSSGCVCVYAEVLKWNHRTFILRYFRWSKITWLVYIMFGRPPKSEQAGKNRRLYGALSMMIWLASRTFNTTETTTTNVNNKQPKKV